MRSLFRDKHLTFPAFMWCAALGVEFGNPLKAAVGEQFGLFIQAVSAAASFEHLEVVLTPFAIQSSWLHSLP